MKRLNLLYVFSLVLSLTLVSCSGEDGAQGEIGPQGMTGPQGEQGIPGNTGTAGAEGTNGADGENGVGFDELARFGSISMILEGARPDGVQFRDSTVFRFTDISNLFRNELSINDSDIDNVIHNFNVVRFARDPNSSEDGSVRIEFDITNIGLDDQMIDPDEFEIDRYLIISSDNMVFQINDTYLQGDLSNFEITGVVFDAETNHLVFQYSLDVSAEDNDSLHPLSISGTVDVIVFEEIDSSI